MMCDKWYKPIDFPEHEENIEIDTDCTLIGKIQSEIDNKKDLIIRHWIEFNKDEFKPYISEEVYSFEDIVNRLRKLYEIEKYQLDIEELNYEIAQVKNCIKDGKYLLNIRNGYLSELEKTRIKKSIEFNKTILSKLEKQKEILENESKKETNRD